ncbi:MAG: outer membrane protein transport protein [Acidobacteriota bacterium]
MIPKNRRRVLLVAAMVLVAPALSWGSGFALFEVGGRQAGMAGTMVAVGDDPSTLFWNPAGMAFQTDEGVQLLFGGALIWPEQTFYGSSPYPGEGYVAEQVEQTFFPPHVFLGIPINDRLEISVALITPFGLGTEWEDDFLGNFIAKKTDLMVFDAGVSLAYQLSENFAFGVGVDYMMATIELYQNVGLINPYNQRLTEVAQAHLKGDGINSDWAWNAGILWKMGGGFSFGASYRSEFKIVGDGLATFTQMPTGYPDFDGLLGTVFPFEDEVPIEASIAFPDFWNVGLAWQNERFMISGQYGVMGWSVYESLPITFPENPEFDTVQEENWEDAYQWRVGIELRASQHWDLRLGYLEDETPQPVEAMSPMLGDGSRKSYMGGFGYHSDSFRFDIAYEYVKLESRSTGGNQHDGFNGTYEGNSPLLHMSMGFKF